MPRPRWTLRDASTDPTALAWLPLVGAAHGILAAGLALAIGRWSSLVGGAVGLSVLRATAEPRATRLWLALLALEALAILRAPVPTQAIAFVLAATLGAWSLVVQCHGGSAVAEAGASGLIGRAAFREFGVASVLAIGGALAVFDAVGLVAVLAAVGPTLLLRAAWHRRYGGMPPWGPQASGRIAEAAVIVVLATLARG